MLVGSCRSIWRTEDLSLLWCAVAMDQPLDSYVEDFLVQSPSNLDYV